MTSTIDRRLPPAVPYILAACTGVSILSTDLITPSIPSFPEEFGTSIRLAQMTVSINLMAYALAQLVHGPVSDAIGRRRLLLVSLGLFACVSVACAFAPGIQSLLGGRFLQGLFSSVPSVVIILMIRELYHPREALSIMTLYGSAVGLAPAIGPLMGGYLHVWFGWEAGFVFVAGLATLVGVAVWRLVPESLPARQPLHLGGALSAYAQLLSHPGFLRHTVGISVIFGAFFAYVTTAPVVFIDIIGLPTQRYGLTNLVIVMAFIGGNMLASRVSNLPPPDRLLRLAALVALAAMIALLVPVEAGMISIWGILVPMSVYAMALAMVMAAGPIVALNQVQSLPQGPAAALLGSAQLAAASLAGYLSARSFDGSAMPMVEVMTGFVALGVALIMVPGRSRAAPA